MKTVVLFLGAALLAAVAVHAKKDELDVCYLCSDTQRFECDPKTSPRLCTILNYLKLTDRKGCAQNKGSLVAYCDNDVYCTMSRFSARLTIEDKSNETAVIHDRLVRQRYHKDKDEEIKPGCYDVAASSWRVGNRRPSLKEAALQDFKEMLRNVDKDMGDVPLSITELEGYIYVDACPKSNTWMARSLQHWKRGIKCDIDEE